MNACTLSLVLSGLVLGSGSQSLVAQTPLYIISNIFETDSQIPGTHPAGSSWQISDSTTSQSAGISEFDFNAAPSPQGGNYVLGPYQGAGNLMDGIYDFTATTGAGTSFLDANANPFTAFVDGEQYEVIYWFRPIAVRNTTDDSVWAMTFAPELTFQLFSEDGLTTLNDTLTLPVSTTGWTEFRIPITYDAAFWNGGAPLFYAVPQFSGWTQTGGPAGGFQPNLGSPSAVFSIAIDTGVAPVPEVSAAALAGAAAAGLLARRRRTQRPGFPAATGRMLPQAASDPPVSLTINNLTTNTSPTVP